jgi:Na+/melibiose symporter-like transporter
MPSRAASSSAPRAPLPGGASAAVTPSATGQTPWTAAAGLHYGALGLPLAFVALPLYVLLPPHYAAVHGAPLAALGVVLLATRLFDAVLDPWLGGLADRLLDRGARAAWRVAALGAAAVALGFALLFAPPAWPQAGLLIWLALGLLWITVAYSLVSIVHHAWGARLGGSAQQRAQVVGWREGAALLGVLAASVLPSVAGLPATGVVLAVLLAVGMALLAGAPRPQPGARAADAQAASAASSTVSSTDPSSTASSAPPASSRWLPWRSAGFRSLLAVFVVNGIASAVPATLVLFFVRDRLQAPQWEPLFLGSYFLAAALSVPLWLRAVPRLGLAGGWLAGMALAVVGFASVGLLQAGDRGAFLAVCLVTGVALGADLTYPPALLAGVLRRSGHGGQAEGAYFGWWQAAAKLNLALGAGLALPLLAAAGYTPGAGDANAQSALVMAYAALPLLMKAAAMALLLRHRARHGEDR